MIALQLAFLLLLGYSLDAFLLHKPYLVKRQRSLTRIDGLRVIPGDVMEKQSLNDLQNLVDARAAARYAGDYSKADALKNKIDAFELPVGVRLVIEDQPYSKGGGSTFRIEYKLTIDLPEGPSVLQSSHMALGMAVSYAERNEFLPAGKVKSIVDNVKYQLRCWSETESQLRSSKELLLQQLGTTSQENVAHWHAIETQLTGRKAADAAFWFALAGSADSELFELLTQVCVKEVKRFGSRPSCRAKDLTAICDKLAAAGVKGHAQFENTIAECLVDKSSGVLDTLNNTLDLHHESCSLMIWKFSARQRKQKSFLRTAAQHWEQHSFDPNDNRILNHSNLPSSERQWKDIFLDVTRPLVVDLGCGMGITLLGLATCHTSHGWEKCNFLGTDLSVLAIGYANGLASRWELGDRLRFTVASAEELIESLSTYPGRTEAVLVQFPTPFRLNFTSHESTGPRQGNLQLPVSIDDGFMVTPKLLKKILAQLKTGSAGDDCVGKLMMQSNCEDVALWVHDMSCEIGFRAEEASGFVSIPVNTTNQRSLRWAASGGKRAVGPIWSADSLLPRNAWSETEVACQINKTPMHRCVLRP
jgi:SAM-dependent methyltransferase